MPKLTLFWNMADNSMEGNTGCVLDDRSAGAASEETSDYENDSFVANDCESVKSIASDVCFQCEDGGELVVCDGGTLLDGCKRAFHVECVGRKTVPVGDWICQLCVAEADLEVDDKGRGREFCCEICNEGNGELFLCLGGDEFDGCKRAFHFKCAGFTEASSVEQLCAHCKLVHSANAIGAKREQRSFDNQERTSMALSCISNKSHKAETRFEKKEWTSKAWACISKKSSNVKNTSNKRRRIVIDDSEDE
jgi:hypothetical protein